LFKLAVEGLPVGADAGVPDEPFFRVRFDHNYDAYEPLKSWAQRFLSILLRFALAGSSASAVGRQDQKRRPASVQV
jgi:hypothetical protein